MLESKVILSLVAPGAVMMGQPNWEVEEHPEAFKYISVKVETKKIAVPQRKCIPVKQVICLNQSAYKQMISGIPADSFRGKQEQWDALPIKAKVFYGCTDIAVSMTSSLFSFTILPD